MFFQSSENSTCSNCSFEAAVQSRGSCSLTCHNVWTEYIYRCVKSALGYSHYCHTSTLIITSAAHCGPYSVCTNITFEYKLLLNQIDHSPFLECNLSIVSTLLYFVLITIQQPLRTKKKKKQCKAHIYIYIY